MRIDKQLYNALKQISDRENDRNQTKDISIHRINYLLAAGLVIETSNMSEYRLAVTPKGKDCLEDRPLD